MAYRLLVVTLSIVSVFLYVERSVNSDTSDENQTEQVARLNIKASFITAMISDGDGGVFVGTEDYGVYHYDIDGNSKQFTRKDGLGDDNAYALATDKLGRLWVGHLNSGVSVFNGERWKNYDVVDGPIGERVFDIQTCPTDGDVWIATSAGITRYKINADEWEHFTREDGLLEDQASSLAFKKDGTLIVGTQCHGIAVFNRSGGNYKHSKNITAPERFGVNNCSPVPLIPEGDGLPTNQINQVIVANDNKIWIATPTGLVRSDSSLKTLYYVRGKDYADKVRGLYGGAPKDWKECPNEVKEYLLPEDYITCIAEDATGTIWLGTRRRGFMAIDPKTGRRGTGDKASMGMADNYVSSILPQPDGKPLIGLYIGGVIKPKDELRLNKKDISKQGKKDKSVAKKDFPKLPSTIKPPTIEELKSRQAKLDKLNKILPYTYAAYLSEDWKTQGDWVGRYGRKQSCMCGASAPFDHHIQPSSEFEGIGFIGPNKTSDDTIRRWVHWLKTDNHKTLYSPLDGYRRQAEWDDHGEAYPMTNDGPDLWVLIDTRLNEEGVVCTSLVDVVKYERALSDGKSYPRETIYKLTMYFFNKDGHTGHNRLRDYIIEIYPSSYEWQGIKKRDEFGQYAEKVTRETLPLEKVRIRDFWGGVHTSFAIKGPGQYLVKIRRNYSFNTILSSVFGDRLGQWVCYEEELPPSLMFDAIPAPPEFPEHIENELSRECIKVWNQLKKRTGWQGFVEKQRKYQIAVYQGASFASNNSANETSDNIVLQSIAWQLNMWDTNQRKIWNDSVQEAWKRFGKENPEYIKQQEELLKSRENGTWKDPWENWDK